MSPWRRQVPEDISLQSALCEEYDRYLSRFTFPEGFWRWAIGGDKIPGATERHVRKQEVDNQVNYYATDEDLLDQIAQQNTLNLKYPKIFRKPLRMGFHMIGENSAHRDMLIRTRQGLWAIQDVFQYYKDKAVRIQEDWAEARTRGEEVPDYPSATWPWRSIFTFLTSMEIPWERPWLEPIMDDPEKIDAYLMNPAVRASEALVLGWKCRLMATAARNVHKENVADAMSDTEDWEDDPQE